MIFLGNPPKREDDYSWCRATIIYFGTRDEPKHIRPTKPPIVWMLNRLLYGETYGAFVTGGYSPPKPLSDWQAAASQALGGWWG